jgi:hypothetical protein
MTQNQFIEMKSIGPLEHNAVDSSLAHLDPDAAYRRNEVCSDMLY